MCKLATIRQREAPRLPCDPCDCRRRSEVNASVLNLSPKPDPAEVSVTG